MSMISGALTALQRADSWYNSITGLGSTRDRTAYGTFVDAPDLSDSELEALFEDSGVARIIVSIFPEETMRQGVGIGGVSPEESKAIDERCEQLDLFAKIEQAMIWGRLYGGGMLVLGADDGRDARLPLEVDAVRSLVFVDVYDKRDVYRERYYADPAHPKFGQVSEWRIQMANGGHRYVHESRCVLFGGALTSRSRKRARQGWDQSVLQAGYDELRRFSSVDGAAENLVLDSSVGVYTLQGLIKSIAGLGGEEMSARAAIMDKFRNSMRSILLDAGGDGKNAETYTRTDASFAGLPDMLDRFAGRLAMVYRIPVPVLMGEAPAGLNATGEAPVRLFYDRVRTSAKRHTPNVSRCLLVVARSLGIAATPSCEWPSLWQLTPAEQDQHADSEAKRDVAYIQEGVLLAEEVAKMRFAGNASVDLELRESNESGTLALTPSDAATVVTVNEARASMGLSALPDVESGAMSLAAYRAKLEGGGALPQLPAGPAVEGDGPTGDERKTDESVEHFAARMTEKQIERCVHGKNNICRLCRIERVRDVDDDGNFTIAWKAIQ